MPANVMASRLSGEVPIPVPQRPSTPKHYRRRPEAFGRRGEGINNKSIVARGHTAIVGDTAFHEDAPTVHASATKSAVVGSFAQRCRDGAESLPFVSSTAPSSEAATFRFPSNRPHQGCTDTSCDRAACQEGGARLRQGLSSSLVPHEMPEVHIAENMHNANDVFVCAGIRGIRALRDWESNFLEGSLSAESAFESEAADQRHVPVQEKCAATGFGNKSDRDGATREQRGMAPSSTPRLKSSSTRVPSEIHEPARHCSSAAARASSARSALTERCAATNFGNTSDRDWATREQRGMAPSSAPWSKSSSTRAPSDIREPARHCSTAAARSSSARSTSTEKSGFMGAMRAFLRRDKMPSAADGARSATQPALPICEEIHLQLCDEIIRAGIGTPRKTPRSLNQAAA